MKCDFVIKFKMSINDDTNVLSCLDVEIQERKKKKNILRCFFAALLP